METSIEESLGDLIHGEEEVIEEVAEVEEPVEESAEEPEVEGDEPEEEPPEPVVEGDDDTVEVEFEGQLIEAPKLVAEALMRNKDYTEKTQALAADRKQVEIQGDNLKRINAEYEFARQIQSEVIKANQIESQIDQTRTYLRENVDSLSHTDIEKIRIAIDDLSTDRDKIINEVTNKNSEFQQAQKQTLEELLTKSTEVLRQKVPGWGEKHEAEIKDYALSLGVPEVTFQSVVDPLEKLILHKAMQYDALKSGAVPAVTAVKTAPTIKSKSRSVIADKHRTDSKLRKQLKSKNISDKAKSKLLEDDIGNRLFS